MWKFTQMHLSCVLVCLQEESGRLASSDFAPLRLAPPCREPSMYLRAGCCLCRWVRWEERKPRGVSEKHKWCCLGKEPLHPERVGYKLERDSNIKSNISVMKPFQSRETNLLVYFFLQPIKGSQPENTNPIGCYYADDSEERGEIVSLLKCRYNYDILYILQPVPKSYINICYALWRKRS